jgi:predicted AAA+ superfamily ATPase
MKNRDYYLTQLVSYKDKHLIKVITGIRRCGKSTLLSLFENYLLQIGIEKNHIIRMNFESFEFDSISNYKELHTIIQNKITNPKDRYYILLDEIQQIPSWEKVINALIADANVDIYITGSNAHLLSSELSTLLSGRYVEIKMLPLSFKEFVNFLDTPIKNEVVDNSSFIKTAFNQYLQYGGLPMIPSLLESPNTIGPFLEGIYNTVLMKDVMERNRIRDTTLLENILKFLASNVGSIMSTKKISDTLTSNGRKTTSDTIENYLKMLQDAYVIYKASRFDLRGKKLLKTQEKYYIVDIGLRNQLVGVRNTDIGHILENIVYLELCRRGYEVHIGQVGKWKVDFIATKSNKKTYFQVAYTIQNEKTRNRELQSLTEIPDNYPKYIVTMDPITIFQDFEGIRTINLIQFLLDEKACSLFHNVG